MSPFLGPCHTIRIHHPMPPTCISARASAVTCSILQQSSLFDVVQPPFPFHSLLSLSWHSFLQHPPLQMVSISPSEVPKILQLPPLDLFLSTATLSFRILIPTYPRCVCVCVCVFFFFNSECFYEEKKITRKDQNILSKYCCIINHTSQLFSSASFTEHVLSNYFLSGTVLGPGDQHINKTQLIRKDKCGLNKVWGNRLQKLQERTITCTNGEYHKKVHVVGHVVGQII